MEKTSKKIFLDVTIMVLYVVLMFGRGLSPLFHEIAGIGIGALFSLHMVWNKSMFAGLRKRIRSGKARIVDKTLYISDLILPLGMLLSIGTGVIVSSELFRFSLGNAYGTFAWVHNFLSYVCFVIIGLHLAMHAQYLAAVFRAMGNASGRKAMLHSAKRFAAIASILIMLYGTVSFVNGKFNDVEIQPADNQDDAAVDIEKQDVDNQDAAVETQPDTSEPEVTLDEYLSGLICTACHKQCPLIAPQCGKGERQLEAAKVTYEETYMQ